MAGSHRPQRPHRARSAPQLVIFTCLLTGVLCSEVQVPARVSAVMGKNVTLSCHVDVGSNLSLTQSSWERRLPWGMVTVAVYNPEFGISIPPEYQHRLSFRSPSSHDATIVLEDVTFADDGVYTCKVATFPLGNTQASTYVSVLVEPKVYVSSGPLALLDEGNETLVATCTAERARPAADVSWESSLFGRSQASQRVEPHGTVTTQARYDWNPTRRFQGHNITCVVRHPALQSETRIPYMLNVQFAPDVTVVGYDSDWFVGQENVQLGCRANANPPVHTVTWTRLDSDLKDDVTTMNNTLVFSRPLRLNDSGVYRCEVANGIGTRSRDTRINVVDPPPTTAVPTTLPPALPAAGLATTPPGRHRAQFTSPTLASLSDSSLGSVVGGAVGGALFLVLLLGLGGACLRRRRRTFRGDYYTKQYLGLADVQKEAKAKPQQVQGDGAMDPRHGPVLSDKDREEWGDRGVSNGHSRALRESHTHSQAPPNHVSESSTPYLPEDYDHSPEGDYVAHLDGSVISRREWYV